MEPNYSLIIPVYNLVTSLPELVKRIDQTFSSINETYETMGFGRALRASLDLDVLLNAATDPVKEEFNRIRKEDGLAAAIAWRDARFDMT